MDFAPPLLLAAQGGVLSERSGVVNIGLEGLMRFGAFFALLGAWATGSAWAGIGCGAAAGAAGALLHGWLSIRWRADQVVSGVALNLLSVGLVTFLLEAAFHTVGTSPAVTPLPPLRVDSIDAVPLLGPIVSGHTALTWAALATPFALHFVLYRTTTGLRIRAAGENPRAVATLGVSVAALRYGCVAGSGVLAGLGGATLSLAVLDHFDNQMPAGQGFLALAAMVFGKWQPLGALGAALFFAGAVALEESLQSSFPQLLDAVPKGFFLALPYMLALLLLAGFVGRAAPPAADGVPYDPEGR